MEQVYRFDFVHDTQAVFRQLLWTMAHPMSERSIEKEAAGFPWDRPALWAVGCTLMDNETSFCVELDSELERGLAALTLAKQASSREADYIFLSAPLNYDMIRVLLHTAKKGTLADPQLSATLVVSCPSFEGEERLAVTGPGIKDRNVLRTSKYISNICGLRKDLVMEYPCGVDLIFISESGRIMALPRLCRAERLEGKGETEWHM